MSQILFANNASTTIAGAVTNIATTVNLTPGAGALFPTPVGGQYFCATFTDAATGLLNEIVHVTDVTGDVATIVRAQEGTTAIAWNPGDLFSNLVTAGTLEQFSQTEGLDYAVDTGAANAYVVTIAGVAAYTVGQAYLVKMIHTNTGASTVNLNALGAKTLVGAGGAALAANSITAGSIYTLVYDGTDVQVLETNSLGAASGGGGGALLAVNNLTDLANIPTARANINVPTRTGGDASGTWPISISGNAVTATAATTATTANGLNVSNTYTAVDFVATSDERLKDIEEPVSGVLDRIDGVRVFKYRWNAEAQRLGFKDEGSNLGLSAQDVQRVDPSLVTLVQHTEMVQVGTKVVGKKTVGEGKDAVEEPIEEPIFEKRVLGSYLGVDANDMIALLVQAVKELRAEVKTLRGKKG